MGTTSFPWPDNFIICAAARLRLKKGFNVTILGKISLASYWNSEGLTVKQYRSKSNLFQNSIFFL